MPPLEQNGRPRPAELAQQAVVLHVAGAHLQHVGVAADQLDLTDVHHLCHQLQIVPVAGAAQHPQARFAETLEAVGRAPGLERPAAQHLGPGPGHRRGRRIDLLLGLGGAGSGHHDDLVAPDSERSQRHDRGRRLERAAGQLVGLRDAQHLLDAVHDLDQAGVELPIAADRPEHRLEGAGRAMHVEAPLDERGDDVLNLVFRRPFLHDDHHPLNSLRPVLAAGYPFSGLLAASKPLETARLVDDPLEQADYRDVGQGALVDPPHVIQHGAFPTRLIDFQSHLFLELADLVRTRRPGVQETHDLLVQPIDPIPVCVQLLRDALRCGRIARGLALRHLSDPPWSRTLPRSPPGCRRRRAATVRTVPRRPLRDPARRGR